MRRVDHAAPGGAEAPEGPARPASPLVARLSVVVLTHERREELLRTLGKLVAEHEAGAIVVVDNGSRDGTEAAVAAHFPAVQWVRLARNLGAAGRNHGVQRAATPYVAFCDDDTWWAPGALAHAVALLDAYPRLAVVTARVLVGATQGEDVACRYMGACGRPDPGTLPGLEVAGFLAGACVMRRSAFLVAGGYEPRLLIGGEETLLALDLLAAGWRLAYVPALVVHHYPSPRRDSGRRRHLLLRNALWCAWLRRPPGAAWRETWRRLAEARGQTRRAWSVVALCGLPWVLRHRRVLPRHVETALRLLDPERERA